MNDKWKTTLKNRPQIGLSIMYPAEGILERIGRDWDWIWIDSQHGTVDYHDVLSMVRVCNSLGVPVVVRSESHDPGIIGKYIDMHIDGIMVPMIDNAEQASRMVQAAKFHPLGNRSYGGRRPIDIMGRRYAHEHEPLLICQIETVEGVQNAAEIAAVKGVDAIFFGADDLTLRHGIEMDKKLPPEILAENLNQVSTAAKVNGKICGGVFVSPDAVSQAADNGFTLLVSGGEAALLAQASKNVTQTLRQAIGNKTKQNGENIQNLY